MDEPDPTGAVVLTLAPDGRFARVVRMVVASCASLRDLSVDEIGDVRLLVDTAFHALIELGTGPVEVRVEWSGDRLHVEMGAARRPHRHWNDPDQHILHTVASVLAVDRSFEERDDRLVLRVAVVPLGEPG